MQIQRITRDVNQSLVVQRDTTAVNTGDSNIIAPVTTISQGSLSSSYLQRVDGGLQGSDSFTGAVKFYYANGAAAKNLIIGDSYGLCVIKGSITNTVTTDTNTYESNSVVKAVWQTNPVKFYGFNYEVSDVTQFSNDILYYRAGGDEITRKQLNLTQYQRGNQQDPKIKTFICPITMNGFRAIVIPVAANVTITFTLFTQEQTNMFLQ